jgi:hypothetical protein
MEPGSDDRDLIRPKASSPPKTDADVAPLIQKVGAPSIAQIEKLIGELHEARNLLEAEGERIQRETARYIKFAQDGFGLRIRMAPGGAPLAKIRDALPGRRQRRSHGPLIRFRARHVTELSAPTKRQAAAIVSWSSAPVPAHSPVQMTSPGPLVDRGADPRICRWCRPKRKAPAC